MIAKAFGQWPDIALISKMRKDLDITQQQLAKLSGVPQPVISRIEDGGIPNPSYSAVRKLFEALSDYKARNRNRNRTGTISQQQPVASDLMNKKVVSAMPSSRVKDAWAIMKDRGFSQLPVIDERGRIVGGLSENSLPSDDMEGILEKRVEEVMVDAFPIVGKDTRLPTLVSLLKTEPAVLVVDKGRAIGIVTVFDLMENVNEKNRGLLK